MNTTYLFSFVETPRKFIIAELSIRKLGSSSVLIIRLSEIHKKTGAELVSNSIVGRNLGTKQKVTSQIRPHNTIVDEFGASLALNFEIRKDEYDYLSSHVPLYR